MRWFLGIFFFGEKTIFYNFCCKPILIRHDRVFVCFFHRKYLLFTNHVKSGQKVYKTGSAKKRKCVKVEK